MIEYMLNMSSISVSKLWCVRCSSVGTELCRRNHPQNTQPFRQYFMKSLQSGDSKLEKLTAIWEQILEKRRKVVDIYEQTSAFMNTLQKHLCERINRNKSDIDQILSHKHSLDCLESISLNAENIKDEDLTKDTNKLNQILSWLDQWEEEANPENAEKELQKILKLDSQFIEFKLGTLHDSPQQINVYKKLMLSLKPTDNSPLLNACLSVLSLLVLILKEQEDQSQRENVSHTTQSSCRQEAEMEDALSQGSEQECSIAAESPIKSQTEESEQSALSSDDEPCNNESDSTSVEFDEEARAMRRGWSSTSPSARSASQASITSLEQRQTELLRSDNQHCLFQCRICSEVFRNKGSYCQHLADHNRPRVLKCTACGMIYHSKVAFNKHVARHEKSKLLKCHVCKKVTKDKNDLIAHLSTHSNFRSFKCTICLKVFRDNVDYANHMKVHETPTLRCEICGKRFKQSTELNAHQRTHSNVRLTPCDYCSKTFYSDEYRKRHELICRSAEEID